LCLTNLNLLWLSNKHFLTMMCLQGTRNAWLSLFLLVLIISISTHLFMHLKFSVSLILQNIWILPTSADNDCIKMKNVNGHHKMKNVNVHHYLFLSETYEPVARGTCPLPPWCACKEQGTHDFFLISVSVNYFYQYPFVYSS
jgi:hypothetical protein